MDNDDLISRQAAIDACFDGWNNTADDCAKNIRRLPAADVVKVRHAKDVYKQYNEHHIEQHCDFMCSICGGWIGVIEGGICDFNYCPNCGAKMEGE